MIRVAETLGRAIGRVRRRLGGVVHRASGARSTLAARLDRALDVYHQLGDVIDRTQGGSRRPGGQNRPRRATTFTVTTDRDTALLASAAALRRLGVRIARYDADDGLVESRTAAGRVIVVRATALDDRTSRLAAETDARPARALLRRFRRELSRPARDHGARDSAAGPDDGRAAEPDDRAAGRR